jgi:hypothetical protein
MPIIMLAPQGQLSTVLAAHNATLAARVAELEAANDAQAKGLGEYLRSRLVPVPAGLL